MPAASIQQDRSETAEAALRRGHRALKLKIGFDPAADRANLAALRRLVGDGLLAADVNQALVLRSRRLSLLRSWRSSAWLAGGADPRRPAVAGMEAAPAENQRAAGGRREHRQPRRIRQVMGERCFRRRAAGYRQMGWASASVRHRARHPEVRQDVLSALSRRRHRTAGIGASAGGRRRRRAAGGRLQRESAARSLLWPRDRRPGWNDRAGRRAWSRARA